ncbi:MAG: DUF167 domain-containing protein [Actinobacteria bacterium]|nr:DUF167 domain-containing protein [Actinomycetota bacterium]
MDLSPLYELNGDVVTLHVHVAPGAGRSAVVGRHGDALKVRVAAPPVGGRANDAARSLLAETFDLKDKQVELTSGETSRSKRFKLSKVDVEDFERRLHLLVAPENRPRPT